MKDISFLKLPRSSKKHWGGLYPHPFIANFHALMHERGYSLSVVDEEGGYLAWEKPVFTGYESSVWVGPRNTKKNRPEAFGVSIMVGIESRRQAVVENTIKPWECINLRAGNRAGPHGERVMVLRGCLDWLAERWEPVATNREEGRGRWNYMKTQFSEEIAQDVISVFDRQGADFFDYLGTPLKLANAVRDPVAFPGRRPGEYLDVSPAGLYPEEYAAVLFHDEGLVDQAKAALESSLHRIEAQVKAGRSDAMDVEIQKCKIERYLRWMRHGDVPQGTARIEL